MSVLNTDPFVQFPEAMEALEIFRELDVHPRGILGGRAGRKAVLFRCNRSDRPVIWTPSNMTRAKLQDFFGADDERANMFPAAEVGRAVEAIRSWYWSHPHRQYDVIPTRERGGGRGY